MKDTETKSSKIKELIPEKFDAAVLAFTKQASETTQSYSSDGVHLNYTGSCFAKWSIGNGVPAVYIRFCSTTPKMMHLVNNLVRAAGHWLVFDYTKDDDDIVQVFAKNEQTGLSSPGHIPDMWVAINSFYLETNQKGYDLSMAQNKK